MKKRIRSLLCSLALLVTMLPVSALAGGTGMDATYSTFEAFKEAVETATTTPVNVSDCEFTWPATQETLNVKRPILVDVGTETSYNWTIPQNIRKHRRTRKRKGPAGRFHPAGHIYAIPSALQPH